MCYILGYFVGNAKRLPTIETHMLVKQNEVQHYKDERH